MSSKDQAKMNAARVSGERVSGAFDQIQETAEELMRSEKRDAFTGAPKKERRMRGGPVRRIDV